ncbi:Bug family tripartite tricarboxylate transporter substrate binding protein [Propylenella binzhouense]|uniref:Tripartite tricarboxylate transporter substrate binding protein n=1 Tax=Propylenella binzhouense TaxID=2555902 RepID=A0A964WVF5_9HYPH|nr:tripartite tricarboxylate transporter substrate-binding protein [Propylenella binzhouense]MYZ49998.1 tripartite tricarboxylate transporter substrate binding protein [Propylenella binzhouense]
MFRRLGRVAAVAALILPLAAFSPQNPECIAPANPGGGWDFTCRTVGKLLTDTGLVSGQVQVTNMTGAVGAVAYANVASKRSDDPDLVVATSTVGITQIAQGKYPAGVDAMRWLAMLGADVGVVLVQKDSKFNSLQDLLAALKADPGSVVAAGSSGVGGWDHLRLLMLLEKAGMATDQLKSVKWVEFSGGGDAVTQLMGGHIGVVSTDIGEIGGFIQSGDVKVLGVMSGDRLEAFPDAPTAKEQGVDFEGYNWRGFYMGGKVSDEAYDGWLAIMQKLYESKEWQETAKSKGLTPIWRGGKDFEAFVRQSEENMRKVSKAIGVIK